MSGRFSTAHSLTWTFLTVVMGRMKAAAEGIRESFATEDPRRSTCSPMRKKATDEHEPSSDEDVDERHGFCSADL